MSYNGKVDFGLLGDYDAMPDLEDFGGYLEESLEAARRGAERARRRRARTEARSPARPARRRKTPAG